MSYLPFTPFIVFSVLAFIPYFLLPLAPSLSFCDIIMHILYFLCISIVIPINFSSFLGLYLFCLKKRAFAHKSFQQQIFKPNASVILEFFSATLKVDTAVQFSLFRFH